MCGRYTLTTTADAVREHFVSLFEALPEFQPRYNIAPSQDVLAIADQDGGHRPGWYRWGLVPFWAKDPKIGYKMINARGETVDTKPAYRNAFRRRRCLIPADGFYEWRRSGKQKTPYRFTLRSGEPFAFAGLWETWQPRDGGETVQSCTVLTTTPNELVTDLHDRMPVILRPDDYEDWFDPAAESDFVKALLRPYPAEEMEKQQVSTAVNSPKNQGPELLEAAE